MFDRLSLVEKANLYGAVGLLETQYGHDAVQKGLLAMWEEIKKESTDRGSANSSKPDTSKTFEKPSPGMAVEFDGKRIDNMMVDHIPDFEQLELIPDERKKTRRVIHKRRKGENRETMERFIKEHGVFPNVEDYIMYQYYITGFTQQTIGDVMGVNQRAISEVLKHIPEKRKRKFIERRRNQKGVE